MRELDKALNELEFQKMALDEHAIVSIADVKGDIIYANQKFCDISGYTLEELKGKNHRLVKSGEHPPEFFKEMWRTIASGRVWQGEICNRSRHGVHYWVRSSIVPFLNEQGKPFRYVSIRTDITERKKLEQEIEESHKFLTGITENIGESVYVLDAEGNCTFMNHEAERQLGWRKEELLGKNIHDKIHYQNEDGSHMPQHECPAYLSINEGLKYQADDQVFTRKDGSLFPVSIVSVPLIEDGMSYGSVTVFQDISERLEAERTLRSARDQAEHTSRMKSEFLANMSHEIRTPMNGMLGTIELLRDTPLNETQYEYVEAAHRSSEHLLTLINDILDLSKFEAGSIELESVDFDLTEALEDLADLYAANAQGKGLELIWGIASDVPEWVKGDRVRLWQVLTNLTGNAIKFTEQGSVSIKASLHQADNDALQLRFEITDTGIGIPKAAQERIFNAFEQADGSMTRRFGGTGLGLSLSKRLVGLMGGEIGIDSEPGAGSTFWFTVALQPSSVSQQPLCDSILKQKRVLIVDDVALNRKILERFTHQWGMQPHCVESGEAALQALEESANKGEGYDLALIDHQMPGINGLILAGHIRQQPRFANTKLVLHSSEAEKLSKQPEQLSYLDAILRKPLRRRTLHHQMLRLYDQTIQSQQTEQVDQSSEWLHQRVLLVDDNDVNRMIARGMLEKQGITTIEMAENGQQALELVQANHYDMVLMDVQMPVMNGHEATRAIRQYEGGERHTTVIALTAHAFAEDIERCTEAGMDDYLSKPLQQTALKNIMAKWLNAKSADDHADNTSTDEAPQEATPVPDTESSAIDSAAIAVLMEVLGVDGLKLSAETFMGDAPKQIANMHAAFENSDWELLSRSAHTLKGSSGNFGATRLAELSHQLELQARAQKSEDIGELIDEVENSFLTVDLALRSCIS
jgi:PAS domain S-box-containing protein